MLGHIFPVDFIHCIYIIKKLHAHTSREFILVLIRHGSIATVTTISVVYSIKSKSLIITNMIIHQSVCIGVMYDGFMWNYSN